MNLRKGNFNIKREYYSCKRLGERQYLNKESTKDLMAKLNAFFQLVVEIPRIKHGNRQTVETLINEEALLFAQLRRRIGILGLPLCQSAPKERELPISP